MIISKYLEHLAYFSTHIMKMYVVYINLNIKKLKYLKKYVKNPKRFQPIFTEPSSVVFFFYCCYFSSSKRGNCNLRVEQKIR